MADFKQCMEAELENIQKVLSKLPDSQSLSGLSELEVAGVAALVHSFYNGIENILILTGESYQVTPLAYLKEAVDAAKRYFPSISLEVHPMDESEYRELFEHGVQEFVNLGV